jgi:hypothetical protein
MLVSAAEAATLIVSSVGFEAAKAEGVTAPHHYRRDHELQTNGTFELARTQDFSQNAAEETPFKV